MRDLFKRRNLIAFIIKIIGAVIVIWGVISGMVLMAKVLYEFGEFAPEVGIAAILSPAILGVLIIGFGEVIDLLQKIYQQNDPIVEEEPKVKEDFKPKPLIPLYAERTIQDYYSEKGMEIGKILPTRNRDVFAVEVNGETEYIELGGFSPIILSAEEAEKYLDDE